MPLKTRHWAGATLHEEFLRHRPRRNPRPAERYFALVRHSAIDRGSLLYSPTDVRDRRWNYRDGEQWPYPGHPKTGGMLVVRRSLQAVDATCSRVMGIDPNKLIYLNAPGRLQCSQEASIT